MPSDVTMPVPREAQLEGGLQSQAATTDTHTAAAPSDPTSKPVAPPAAAPITVCEATGVQQSEQQLNDSAIAVALAGNSCQRFSTSHKVSEENGPPNGPPPPKKSKTTYEVFVSVFSKTFKAENRQADAKQVRAAARAKWLAMDKAEQAPYAEIAARCQQGETCVRPSRKQKGSKRKDRLSRRPASAQEMEQMKACFIDLSGSLVAQDHLNNWCIQKKTPQGGHQTQQLLSSRSTLSGVPLSVGADCTGWYHKRGHLCDLTLEEYEALPSNKKESFVLVQSAEDLGSELDQYAISSSSSVEEGLGSHEMEVLLSIDERNVVAGKRKRSVGDYRKTAWAGLYSPPCKQDSQVPKSRKKRKKPMKTDEGSVYGKVLGKVRGGLSTIRREQALLDAYEGGGWGGCNWKKIKPEAELKKARSTIKLCKIRIREAISSLQALYPGVKMDAYDSDGIDAEEIKCCVCGQLDCEGEGNDIILCDAKGCDRAYHQLCVDPPLSQEDLNDDDWFCPTCDCRLDCIDHINDEFESSVKDDSELFPEVDEEESDIGPKDESDEEDEDFQLEEQEGGGSSSSSSSTDSDEEGDAGGEPACVLVEIEDGELQALQAEAAGESLSESKMEAKVSEEDLENFGRGKRVAQRPDYMEMLKDDKTVCRMSDDSDSGGSWHSGDEKDDVDFTGNFWASF